MEIHYIHVVPVAGFVMFSTWLPPSPTWDWNTTPYAPEVPLYPLNQPYATILSDGNIQVTAKGKVNLGRKL